MKNITNKILAVVLSGFALTNTVTAQPSNKSYREMEKRDDNNNSVRSNQNSVNQYPNDYNNQNKESCNQQDGNYYYPDADIYYNPRNRNYSYNNGSAWLTVSTLPFRISLNLMPRVMVYSHGPQIWSGNYKPRKIYCNPQDRYYDRQIVYNNSRNDRDRWGNDRKNDYDKHNHNRH